MTESERDDRATIAHHIARTLYICSIADAHDDPDEPFDAGEEAAGSGQDWFDTVTSETPQEAIEAACKLVEQFEFMHDRSVVDACAEWTTLDHYYASVPITMELFAYRLAMQSLGHGVGLWDDFRGPEPEGFETPCAEFHIWGWYDGERP